HPRPLVPHHPLVVDGAGVAADRVVVPARQRPPGRRVVAARAGTAPSRPPVDRRGGTLPCAQVRAHFFPLHPPPPVAAFISDTSVSPTVPTSCGPFEPGRTSRNRMAT